MSSEDKENNKPQNDELLKNFDHMINDFNNIVNDLSVPALKQNYGSYRYSKKDIKQDKSVKIKQNTEKIQNNSNSNNIPSYYDLNTFTEIEDENGDIVLIKYSDVEYEYRGNQYCQYILINEDTGYREDGIAQIKGGQKVHIKDQKRVDKIKEYMDSKKVEAIEWCKCLKECYTTSGDKIDVVCIGYYDKVEYFDTIMKVYFQGSTSNYQDFIYTYNVRYEFYCSDSINKKVYAEYCLRLPDSMLSFKKLIKDKSFHKINEIIYPILSKDNQFTTSEQWFINISVIFAIVALLYPITEIIFWIFAHIVPIFTDTISTVNVTDFAIKYFPYAYHPDFGWFKHFSINLLCLILFGFLMITPLSNLYNNKMKQNKPLQMSILTLLLSVGFIYSLFCKNVFDIIGWCASVITVILIFIFR